MPPRHYEFDAEAQAPPAVRFEPVDDRRHSKRFVRVGFGFLVVAPLVFVYSQTQRPPAAPQARTVKAPCDAGPLQREMEFAKQGLYQDRAVSGFSSGEWLTWSTPPEALPASAADPTFNTTLKYSRQLSPCAQTSVFDLRVAVRDERGTYVHNEPETKAFLLAQVEATYLWDPAAWRAALLASGFAADAAEKLLVAKAAMFWELLAEHVASRVFGLAPDADAPVIEKLVYYGPQCVFPDGRVDPKCGGGAIAGAKFVDVLTHIDGRRDNLNPTTRWILLHAERGQRRASAEAPPRAVDEAAITFARAGPSTRLLVPRVVYEVEVQGGPGRASLAVASPRHERLDVRPDVGNKRPQYALKVFAQSGEGRALYPDYNRLYLPLRHLVLQGRVADPWRPGAAYGYPSTARLEQALAGVVQRLFAEPQQVATEMRPFFNATFYRPYPLVCADAAGAIGQYESYILPLVAKGLAPDASDDVEVALC